MTISLICISTTTTTTFRFEVINNYAVLDSSVDSRFDSSRNRPALAQTF
ncbi:MAG: hypothetical protein F6K62_12295, partial [Sphaerospermopsis sp. SIO1G2]|nr:hypothetical protein [Sphaerospermopsis sp. SIO1G2]